MPQTSDEIREFYPDFAREDPAKRGRISPSKVAAGCLLATYLDLIEADYIDERRSYDNVLTLEVGKFIHERLQTFFGKMNEARGWLYLPELRLQISEYSHGSADAGLLTPEGDTAYIHEYKTCSSSVFESITRAPKEVHELQGQIYLSGATLHPVLPVAPRSIVFLYLCRDNFRMKEFEVFPDAKKQDEMHRRIDLVETAKQTGMPPPATVHWQGTSPCTRVCIYRQHCPEARKLGRKL